MKRIIFITFILSNFYLLSIGQIFSISHDKSYILYAGIGNPITIAAENLSSKSVIVKTDNGSIEGSNGHYTFYSKLAGVTNIILYKKVNGKIKEIGRNTFKIKTIPYPTFKIGSGKDRIPIPELQSQQFVRADMDGYFGYDVHYSIDSFTVCIISTDTCRYIELDNAGNKISDEMKAEFSLLKPNDILIFKNIICHGPDGKIALSPKMVLLY